MSIILPGFTWGCHRLCDGRRAMTLPRARSAALWVQAYADCWVHSLTSVIHIFLGLPRGRLPSIFPSNAVVNMFPLLFTWPKYFIFLFWILFRSCLLVCNFSRTDSLVTLSLHLTLPNLLIHHISIAFILSSRTLDKVQDSQP